MSTEGDGTAAPPVVTGFLLEKEKRFSDSVLWSLQRNYYAQKGPTAWHSGEVPSYATCNTFIAQSYAHVVISYLRDAKAAGTLDPQHPVYIVELAAGVGRFAYQFLNKFHQLLRESSLRKLDVRYVMTDFTSTNLKVWSGHPHLAPYVSEGLLDFGTFDVDVDREVKLHSGAVLSAKTVKNPLTVIANYAFDTFRHDIFRIADGTLHEVQVTTRSPDESPDLNRIDLISKLKVQYSERTIGDSYYPDPALNKVLAHYKETLAEVSITIPYGGMLGLKSLIDIAAGRLLLISSDKGFTHEDELYHPSQLAMQFHTGCFSMMVNYHAIGQYFIAQGGHYRATARRSMNLRTAACILGGDELQFADTLSTIHERIQNFGPGEFFDFLQQQRQERKSVSIETFLGLLRMSNWDPGVVFDYAAQLRAMVGGLHEGMQMELRLAMERAWQNYYPGPQNLPFEIARILMSMRRPVEALRYNQIGVDWFGDNPAAYLNMGICNYYAENTAEALRCFKRTLEMNPSFGLAREWMARIHAEIAQGVAPIVAIPVHVPTVGERSVPSEAPTKTSALTAAANGDKSAGTPARPA